MILNASDFSVIISIISILIICTLLYVPRISLKTYYIYTGFFIGVIVVLQLVALYWCGNERTVVSTFYTAVIPSLLYFYFMSKYRNGRFFFTFCFISIMWIWIMDFTNLICFFTGMNDIIMLLARTLLFVLLDYFIIYYLRLPYLKTMRIMEQGWKLFSIISELFFLLTCITSIWPQPITSRPQDIPAFCILLIIIPLVYYAIFRAVNRQIELYQLNQSQAMLEIQVKSFQKEMDAELENEHILKIMKHDLRHYIHMIRELMESGCNKEIADVLHKMDVSLMGNTNNQYCKDPVINSVLKYFVKIALEKEIRLEIQFQIPELFPADSIEFSVVFSNALENACNACAQIEKKEKRIITVNSILGKHYFIVELTNTYEGDITFDEEGLPITSANGHGIGTKSIAAFVKKYNAVIDYEAKNSIFCLRILLPQNELLV